MGLKPNILNLFALFIIVIDLSSLTPPWFSLYLAPKLHSSGSVLIQLLQDHYMQVLWQFE